jgi:hypothetical protein
MRRTAAISVLIALLVPAAAWAGQAVLGDGTLSVRNGDGTVRLDLDRGVVIGRLGEGTIQLFLADDPLCASPLVWNEGEPVVGVAELRTLDGVDDVPACIYKGEKGVSLRFRLLGSDATTIRIIGENISLSAVGRGKGTIRSRGDLRADGTPKPDGTWSVNGADYVSLPEKAQGFPLRAQNTGD